MIRKVSMRWKYPFPFLQKSLLHVLKLSTFSNFFFTFFLVNIDLYACNESDRTLAASARTEARTHAHAQKPSGTTLFNFHSIMSIEVEKKGQLVVEIYDCSHSDKFETARRGGMCARAHTHERQRPT